MVDRALTAACAVGADAAMLAALAGNSADSAGVGGISGFWIDLEEAVRSVEAGTVQGCMRFSIRQPPRCFRSPCCHLVSMFRRLAISSAPSSCWPPMRRRTGRITVVDARGLAVGQSPLELRSSTKPQSKCVMRQVAVPACRHREPGRCFKQIAWPARGTQPCDESSHGNAHYHISARHFTPPTARLVDKRNEASCHSFSKTKPRGLLTPELKP